jgi:hypothetical protein
LVLEYFRTKAPEKRAISSKFLHRFVPHLHVYQSNDVLERNSMKERAHPKQRKRIEEGARPKHKQKTVYDAFFPGA